MVIGVYDSGLGGLDILNKMIRKYPNNTYIYVADNKYCPYGIKSNEELNVRINKVMKFFEYQKVDFVVVACNTVSALIINKKHKYLCKIYTILEANIDLIKEYNIKDLCIIATSSLIRSEIFNQELNCDIQYLNGSLLVKYIEENDDEKINQEINVLMKLVHTENKGILLACTHFPLYKNLFIAKKTQKIILEGSKKLIYSLPMKNDSNIQSINIFLSKNDKLYENKIKNILKDYIILIHNINI